MKAITSLVCITLLSLPVAAEVYKWVDANGKVQYGDQPPTAKDKEKPLKIQSQKGVETVSQKAVDNSKQEAEQGAAKEQAAKEKEKNCKAAKSNFAGLQSKGDVYRFDEKGEKKLLDAAERKAELDNAQEAMKRFCEPT